MSPISGASPSACPSSSRGTHCPVNNGKARSIEPTQIVALGTRQVGEVLCLIDNRQGQLLPGTNVNVEILAKVVNDALTLPKEAIQHQNGETGVFVLNGQSVEWKQVTLGVANSTRTQVEGLRENDAVALPSDKPLKNGMPVNPQFT